MSTGGRVLRCVLVPDRTSRETTHDSVVHHRPISMRYPVFPGAADSRIALFSCPLVPGTRKHAVSSHDRAPLYVEDDAGIDHPFRPGRNRCAAARWRCVGRRRFRVPPGGVGLARLQPPPSPRHDEAVTYGCAGIRGVHRHGRARMCRRLSESACAMLAAFWRRPAGAASRFHNYREITACYA